MDEVMEIFELLLDRFGPQHWWPADSPFEVIVGAILMPRVSWANVEKAIANLKTAQMLDPESIASSPLKELRRLVKPAGLHKSKPRRLRGFCRHLMRASGGNVDAFLARDHSVLRPELLSLEGIGPETADSILLYAANMEVFVVDAYTIRIGTRVGLFGYDDYDMVQDFFHDRVKGGVKVFQEYHALLVTLAKDFCRPRPKCAECPLNRICAHFCAENRRF